MEIWKQIAAVTFFTGFAPAIGLLFITTSIYPAFIRKNSLSRKARTVLAFIGLFLLSPLTILL
ncbi:MAG: hypothetical protein UW43_C0001G0085 [Candidatus Yanofskybacteria bacterium GW2011_GWA1_44_21]|uniref:Uncharacterized protein n=2 Tax=Candidatus Yanofskyibacteriota TaxID=1752733 RepID=A0A1F8H0F9_9BACT|nr:MAG: hypothetical protein UW43_C0001G0085 [Candidatus Yanofskybacteria bacterium GW2011_GWA1_44_21]KKT90492.1 MAG: hypothetical protein UW90_C0001G0080 [Candidatus Yanofskybacteria bacterium GW2011_GWB1_45_11]OGN31165.1 MAG: hypothetical protein A3I96_02640 [Candidatus Yanofskybacteria bacterium RIFCSPLOWO2_02_FULL_44_18]